MCRQGVGLENKRHQRSDMDKKNQKNSINRDEGRYQLSHVYDDLLKSHGGGAHQSATIISDVYREHLKRLAACKQNAIEIYF